MEVIRYQVRALKDGKVVVTNTYKKRSRALRFLENQIDRGRAVRIRKFIRQAPLVVEENDVWGISKHGSWSVQSGALSTIFIHTSVTTQLSPLASVGAEREQMRVVDGIAHARGFDGFSYSFGVFPSGRAYEGRGWRVVEAATEGFNTSSDSICTIGNTDVFDPTKAQVAAIVAIINRGQARGHYTRKVNVRAHREVAPKACPGAKFTDALIRRVEAEVNG